MSSPSVPLDTHWPDARAPIVLLATRCSWTARAIEAALGAQGLATLRTPDVAVSSALCASGAVDAAIIDERAWPLGTKSASASCRRVLDDIAAESPLPLMLLARELPALDAQEAAYEAGAWGIACYPVSGQAWVRQLATWVRARERIRRESEAGLVDPATSLYNAAGLERRAREVDAATRRTGGPLGCGVLAFGRTTAPRAADVAAACRAAGRAADVFGRIDADTFAVIAPGAREDVVHALLARIASAATGATAAHPRIGVCAVDDARAGTLSVDAMLARAMEQMLAAPC